MDEEVSDRLNKVLPQHRKDLRVLHNFKEEKERNVADPKNFPDVWITSGHS